MRPVQPLFSVHSCLRLPGILLAGQRREGPPGLAPSSPAGPATQTALTLSPFNPMAECSDPCPRLPGASPRQAPVFPATTEGGGEVAAWLRGARRVREKEPEARGFIWVHRGARAPERSCPGHVKEGVMLTAPKGAR